MSQSFAGKSVVVAGGTGGLGRSVSVAFLEAGAAVCVTYRNAGELSSLQEQAGSNVARLDSYETDVTDDRSVRSLFETVIAKHGRVDSMVNTVGGYIGGVRLWDMDWDGLERMLTLNMRA